MVDASRGYVPEGDEPSFDERGDAYAFGVVLLELLTGAPPDDLVEMSRVSDPARLRDPALADCPDRVAAGIAEAAAACVAAPSKRASADTTRRALLDLPNTRTWRSGDMRRPSGGRPAGSSGLAPLGPGGQRPSGGLAPLAPLSPSGLAPLAPLAGAGTLGRAGASSLGRPARAAPPLGAKGLL